ncbi:hypothetical protein LINGRAHAP2_LOCUS31054 [Linum grandiflorum]
MAESPSAASPLSRGGHAADGGDDRCLHSLHFRCWLLLQGWWDEG